MSIKCGTNTSRLGTKLTQKLTCWASASSALRAFKPRLAWACHPYVFLSRAPWVNLSNVSIIMFILILNAINKQIKVAFGIMNCSPSVELFATAPQSFENISVQVLHLHIDNTNNICKPLLNGRGAPTKDLFHESE